MADQEWVMSGRAMEILGVKDQKTFAKMAEEGYITSRQLPGCRPRYLLSDLHRLIEVSTRPATKALEPAGKEVRP